jgi:hypothetical protein
MQQSIIHVAAALCALAFAGAVRAAPVTGEFTLAAQSGSGFGSAVYGGGSGSNVANPASYTGSFVVDSALLNKANGSYNGSGYISAFTVQIGSIVFDLGSASSSLIQNVVVTDHQITGLNLSLVSPALVPNAWSPTLSIFENGQWSAQMYASPGYVATPILGGAGSAQFSVSAVPEPATYTMLLGGLGLLGFAARRRQRC